jgi:hypothetical protein
MHGVVGFYGTLTTAAAASPTIIKGRKVCSYGARFPAEIYTRGCCSLEVLACV